MNLSPQPTPHAASRSRGSQPRNFEYVLYQVGTLGAILLVLSSLLIL